MEEDCCLSVLDLKMNLFCIRKVRIYKTDAPPIFRLCEGDMLHQLTYN